ncbi:MAG: ATP-binding protein [Thermoanaerobaculales bacterium]|jgi:MinD superfamily P-loop ATPase|nr:ATP-binding protein [Thermoanaerobaculales bacterium]
MRQIVVVSGKGGTGKTSVVASFAALAERPVLVDCDVDAADLHLVVQPTLVSRQDFIGGVRAAIDPERCNDCGECAELCRFGAIVGPAGERRIDPMACEGCGVCAWFCPAAAIDLVDRVDGEWYLSETRFGPLVHARLRPAGESSGKLVSLLRDRARSIAAARALDTVLVDGSPGIGCPVIASVTGADVVLVVTEPTLSGLHDLERVVCLTRHFGIPTLVAVNRWDVNEENTRRIEDTATRLGAAPAGRIRLDPAVTEAQIEGLPVVELTGNGAAGDIERVWRRVDWSSSVGRVLR